MVDHEYWSRVDFQAEALSLCSKVDTAFVGQSTIENGPIHRVERGDGILIPTYVPHLIVDCFAKTLATMAALGNQRAVALSGRTDLSELLKRTGT